MLLVDRLVANDDDDAKIDLLVGLLVVMGASDRAAAKMIDEAFGRAVVCAHDQGLAGQLRDAQATVRKGTGRQQS